MNKIINFFKKVDESLSWNIFIIILFTFFAVTDFIANNKLLMALEIFVVISESLALSNNLKRRKK